jgi:hypothetical protein
MAQDGDRAQDENLACAIGIQIGINRFPMMDLYRTLNEFFVFDRLITCKDDWDKLSAQTQRGPAERPRRLPQRVSSSGRCLQ